MTFAVVQDIQTVREGVVRYRITLDSGRVWMVHSGTLKRLGLKNGMFLDEEVYDNEVTQSEASEAREFALRSLTARGRTAAELTGILTRKGFAPEIAARTVLWVNEKGLIEEDVLLEDTVELLMKRKGVHQVRQILGQRGFSKTEADRVLKEKAREPEHYEQVLAIAGKKKRELETRYPQEWSRRLAAWLYGKGHDGDMIKRVLTVLKVPDQTFED